jgi:predicted kinase
MCGVGGSGKSTLAAELSGRSGLPHVSSDRIRKELAGIPPGEHAPPDAYDAAHTERTYAELAERAAAAVEAHGGAIADATFSTRAQRAALIAALRHTDARVLWVECHAPRAVLERRGAAREHGPEQGSDATWAVIAGQLDAREPLDDVPAADRRAVATDRAVPVCLDEVDCFVAAAVVQQ